MRKPFVPRITVVLPTWVIRAQNMKVASVMAMLNRRVVQNWQRVFCSPQWTSRAP